MESVHHHSRGGSRGARVPRGGSKGSDTHGKPNPAEGAVPAFRGTRGLGRAGYVRGSRHPTGRVPDGAPGVDLSNVSEHERIGYLFAPGSHHPSDENQEGCSRNVAIRGKGPGSRSGDKSRGGQHATFTQKGSGDAPARLTNTVVSGGRRGTRRGHPGQQNISHTPPETQIFDSAAPNDNEVPPTDVGGATPKLKGKKKLNGDAVKAKKDVKPKGMVEKSVAASSGESSPGTANRQKLTPRGKDLKKGHAVIPNLDQRPDSGTKNAVKKNKKRSKKAASNQETESVLFGGSCAVSDISGCLSSLDINREMPVTKAMQTSRWSAIPYKSGLLNDSPRKYNPEERTSSNPIIQRLKALAVEKQQHTPLKHLVEHLPPSLQIAEREGHPFVHLAFVQHPSLRDAIWDFNSFHKLSVLAPKGGIPAKNASLKEEPFDDDVHEVCSYCQKAVSKAYKHLHQQYTCERWVVEQTRGLERPLLFLLSEGRIKFIKYTNYKTWLKHREAAVAKKPTPEPLNKTVWICPDCKIPIPPLSSLMKAHEILCFKKKPVEISEEFVRKLNVKDLLKLGLIYDQTILERTRVAEKKVKQAEARANAQLKNRNPHGHGQPGGPGKAVKNHANGLGVERPLHRCEQ